MSKPAKIAVLGAGLIGKRHCEFVASEPEAMLSAIVDPFPNGEALAATLKTKWLKSLDELLATDKPANKPDGIIIATPNDSHVALAIQCLEAGIPVLVEKPIADTLRAAKQLIACEEKTGVSVLVGHHRRHNMMIKEAKAHIAAGMLGNILAVHSFFMIKKPDDYFAPAYRRSKTCGPVLLNLIHDIDNLRHLCGEITEVFGFTAHARGFEAEDTASVSFKFQNGALGTALICDNTPAAESWEMSSGENKAYPQQQADCYYIYGSKGALSLPQMLHRHYEPQGKEGWYEPLIGDQFHTPYIDPLIAQIQHFIAVMRGKSTPIISAMDATRTLAVIEAVKLSSESGKRIIIADLMR